MMMEAIERPTVLLAGTSDASIAAQGGVFAVVLAVAFYLLRRSDEREKAAQARAAADLLAERTAHEVTRTELRDASVRLAAAEARNEMLRNELRDALGGKGAY